VVGRFAASVCDDVMLLSKGRLLASGATDAILTPARIAELYEIDPALTADLVPAGAARDVTTRDSRGDA
jgi:ABC-type cobalamin/Fe3+-siderophores transport system ATPase subunit